MVLLIASSRNPRQFIQRVIGILWGARGKYCERIFGFGVFLLDGKLPDPELAVYFVRNELGW